MNTPKIRFKGFEDHWEQRKLNEIADVRDGTHDSPKYVQEGHPFITSKNVSNGFINYDEVQYITDVDYEEINKRSKVDVHDILMGMIGTIGNLALIRQKPDFAIKNVALIKYTGDVDYQYLYQTLQVDCVTRQLFTGMDGGTQKFVSLKKIRELGIPFTEEQEQQKIGQYFENLDNLITLHQRKCDETKQLKKFMLQNMFPKNGEKNPEIRFEGFTDDWEQRKVSDLLQERNEQAPRSEEYPLMAFIADQGVAPKGERYDRSALVNDENGKKYKRTEYGDFIYSSNNLETGSIGLNKYGNASISPVYSIFKKTSNVDLDFLGRRFLRKDFINEMVKWRQGVVYGQWKIHESDFLKINVVVPSIEEQKRIGHCFEKLDHLITLHQRKCEKLKALKKFMLQNMFI